MGAHRYTGQHAFMNSDRKAVYEAARLAWDRALALLRTHLCVATRS